MTKYTEQTNTKENILYDNIVLLSRNKLFYTTFDLTDTFQNRIHLIFMHISFLFIKANRNMAKEKNNNYTRPILRIVILAIVLDRITQKIIPQDNIKTR